VTTEVQRARARIVSVREEERRRLRRDLHDGLGPQLASQALTLDLAVRLLRADPGQAERFSPESASSSRKQ
jgi:two-component system, NarL family, sensor kinase